MAALISLSLWWIWLSVSVLSLNASKDQRILTAKSGEDITLRCRAENNKNIIVVEWTRADLVREYVFMYRGGYFVPDDQHPSFKNRTDLRDRQMKDGDVSLIVKNVTAADSGTYECRVAMRGANRRKRAYLKTKPITTISLNVPPGQTGGHTEDGGKKDGGKHRHWGVVACTIVFVMIGVLMTVIALIAHKQQKTKNHPPSADKPVLQV